MFRLIAYLPGVLSLVPALLAGQQFPPAAELDSLQREAEAAPLFASGDPLRLELFVDLTYLKRERPDDEEEAALLRFRRPDGRTADTRAQVRTRGNFRRDARNCSFPPLRLDVPTGEMEGTVFHGQDKLKLVFPCREGRDSYEVLVLREYLAYRMLATLTPVSFRVRLVDLTVHDTSGELRPVRHHGFLIESDEAVAARNRAMISEWKRFFPEGMDVDQATTVSLFQFMIGNTDWSPVEFHNALLLRDQEGRYLTVAHDFDFSGLVEAPYATPDPQFPIRDVRERLYRGFCWGGVDYEALQRRFLEARPALEALWHEMELLGDGHRQRGLDYLELFYRVIAAPGTWRRQVVEGCRALPG